MLYSVVLGETSTDAFGWKLDKDDYGSSVITNETLRQRLRLAKNVDPKFNKVNESVDNKTNLRVGSYELPSKIFFSNSFKNMNMNIVNFTSKDKNLIETYVDDNIIYLTLSVKEFKLLEYHLHEDAEILYTYNKRNEFIGCAIVFKGSDVNNVFTLYAKNKKRFTSLTINIKEGKIEVYIANTVTKDVLKRLLNTEKKLSKRTIKFKMQPKNRLLTSTYICDESVLNEVQKLTKSIKNCNIIAIDKNEVLDDKGFVSYEKLKEDAKEVFDEYIKDQNVRAVTLVGLNLPKEFSTEYKILYVFDYDLKDSKLRCIKSN